MKSKSEIVGNWLPRYTGVSADEMGDCVLLTNFGGYLATFCALTGAEVVDPNRPMPTATSDGISMINFGMGSPNAATIMDLLTAAASTTDRVPRVPSRVCAGFSEQNEAPLLSAGQGRIRPLTLGRGRQ